MKATEICPLTREAVEALLAGRQLYGADTDAPGRRRMPRWPFEGPVELWLTDDDGAGDVYLLGQCVNLSCSGMGIRLDEPLESDARCR